MTMPKELYVKWRLTRIWHAVVGNTWLAVCGLFKFVHKTTMQLITLQSYVGQLPFFFFFLFCKSKINMFETFCNCHTHQFHCSACRRPCVILHVVTTMTSNTGILACSALEQKAAVASPWDDLSSRSHCSKQTYTFHKRWWSLVEYLVSSSLKLPHQSVIQTEEANKQSRKKQEKFITHTQKETT